MNLVVDTSIIISVITNEKSKPKLIKETVGNELISPTSLHWEIGNAISAMFKRGRIDLTTAKKTIEYYSQIPIRLVDIKIDNAIEIAHNYMIYAYDAYFLECSRSFNSPLLTLDSGLIEVAEQMNINVIEV